MKVDILWLFDEDWGERILVLMGMCYFMLLGMDNEVGICFFLVIKDNVM